MRRMIFLILLAAGMQTTAWSQARGNYDYRDLSNVNFVHAAVQQQQGRMMAQIRGDNDLEIRIRGLSNCTADSYLAIFTLAQVGKNQEETDRLMSQRISAVREGLKASELKADLFIDMISFLPIYEMEESKKLFSKSTYHEIPRGFELKKNLHFQYRDPAVLDQLVTLCASQDIYDLVRVDYFIDDVEAKKRALIAKADEHIQKKLERYANMMNLDLSDYTRKMAEAFAMYYPIEQYRSYTTYQSNSLNKSISTGETKTTQQTVAQFFLPRMSKEYDYVINNTMLEPVIQIEYELVIRLTPKPKEVAPPPPPAPKEVVKIEKEIWYLTPTGEMKRIVP